jgi:hypothetical protein
MMQSIHNRCRRYTRAAVAAIVGCTLLVTSVAHARPPANMNKGVVPQAQDNSDVGAYAMVIGGLVVGMMAICRRNYRTNEVKRGS